MKCELILTNQYQTPLKYDKIKYIEKVRILLFTTRFYRTNFMALGNWLSYISVTLERLEYPGGNP